LPSKTRPDLFISQDWTDPQKSLTIPYIHGFQTEVARSDNFLSSRPSGLKSLEFNRHLFGDFYYEKILQ